MKAKVQEIIMEEIQPVLASHDGGLELAEITGDKIVKIKLTGACSTCPGKQHTVEQFVEAKIKEALPEVNAVVLQNQVNDDLIKQALKIIRRDR